ncbi:hypothetical protein [Ralstonia sp.]|uniref:hypothetical protein n=1 Tax=Ralstonia sp. TaxID=54061 RepID=UPI0031CDCFF4
MEQSKRQGEDFLKAADIGYLLSRCMSIFNLGALNVEEARSVLYEASVTQLLIWLNDLLQRADDDGKRIKFTDDIAPAIGDVTDLISKLRNAACHIRSKNSDVALNTVRFCVVHGKRPKSMVIRDVVLGCDYEDDSAVFFGQYRLYMRRHALRAVEELAKAYGITLG